MHILQPPQEIREVAARAGLGLTAVLRARGYAELEARAATAYEQWVGSEGSASAGATTPSSTPTTLSSSTGKRSPRTVRCFRPWARSLVIAADGRISATTRSSWAEVDWPVGQPAR